MSPLLASLLLLISAALSAQTPFGELGTGPPSGETPPQLRNVKVDQKLNSQIPRDLLFRSAEGREIRLGELFGNRPLVLALVYYTCPRLCNMTLTGLRGALRGVPLHAGQDYDVVAVSFDPRDQPSNAMDKKKSFGADAQTWQFLTGGKREIERLCHAAGFAFDYDDRTGLYSHASAVIVLTPQGRVSKYFGGVEFAPRDLRLAMVEASEGKIGSRVEQFLLYCFHYDPATGRYSLAILRTIRVLAVACVLLVCGFILIQRRREAVPR